MAALSPAAGSPRRSLTDAQLAAQLAHEEDDKVAADNSGRPSLMAQSGEELVNSAAARGIAGANQHHHAPVQDRAGQEGVMEVAQEAWAWLNHATRGFDQFVVDYPHVAIVMAVVCGIFGISQILPSFLAALLTGIPLCYTSYRIYSAAITRWDEFSRRLAHDAAQGVGSGASMQQVSRFADQVMAGGPQLRGVVGSGYHPAVPGGMSLG